MLAKGFARSARRGPDQAFRLGITRNPLPSDVHPRILSTWRTRIPICSAAGLHRKYRLRFSGFALARASTRSKPAFWSGSLRTRADRHHVRGRKLQHFAVQVKQSGVVRSLSSEGWLWCRQIEIEAPRPTTMVLSELVTAPPQPLLLISRSAGHRAPGPSGERVHQLVTSSKSPRLAIAQQASPTLSANGAAGLAGGIEQWLRLANASNAKASNFEPLRQVRPGGPREKRA